VKSAFLATALFSCAAFAADPWPLPEPHDRAHPAAGTPADPLTYPDAAGFSGRWQILIPALASNDLGKWRRGYFSGGDPGKYLPGAAMARLLLNPKDEEAIRLMNDDRSPKEHYHFAAINWARFLPLFGRTLTPETQATLSAQAAKYSAYLNPGGTENHKTMNLCAANVLPDYLEGGRIANKDRESALREAKEKLRAYVKGLYAAGQGEWDSPTYLMFDLHGMLNIYDFAKDDETRLIAAAALDWFTAAYALKFRDGIYGGPNQRGYYDKPFQSIADQTGWLWWGGTAKPESAASFYYAIHPATSSWRPNAVLTHIADKEIPGLPVTLQNTKPNYWFGKGIPPKAGEYPETLHIAKSFTMGSIWRGFGSQITRFQLVANGSDGPLALTGGHPRKSDHTGKKLDEITYRDGGGRYDQSAQAGPLYVCLSRIPDDEPLGYSFVSIPDGVTPERVGDRWIYRLGDTWACVVPFGEKSEIATADLNPKEIAAREKAAAKGETPPPLPRILKIFGRPSGFAVIAAEAADFPDATAFAKWSEETYKFDTKKFRRDVEVGVAINGREPIVIRHDPAAGIAKTTGTAPPSGAVYSGPFVKLDKSLLEVSDGKSGYAIDFSGDLPVYRTLP
jgi:hypothetical protein